MWLRRLSCPSGWSPRVVLRLGSADCWGGVLGGVRPQALPWLGSRSSHACVRGQCRSQDLASEALERIQPEQVEVTGELSRTDPGPDRRRPQRGACWDQGDQPRLAPVRGQAGCPFMTGRIKVVPKHSSSSTNSTSGSPRGRQPGSLRASSLKSSTTSAASVSSAVARTGRHGSPRILAIGDRGADDAFRVWQICGRRINGHRPVDARQRVRAGQADNAANNQPQPLSVPRFPWYY